MTNNNMEGSAEKTAEPHNNELGEQELEEASGGLNTQPLPPGFKLLPTPPDACFI